MECNTKLEKSVTFFLQHLLTKFLHFKAKIKNQIQKIGNTVFSYLEFDMHHFKDTFLDIKM